ncbi:MAG: peptidylprolyl isomerase [Haliea sp.]|mgnify:FL=1|uniref:peptidylprolyl isomerase n=1 Tax=Haliea sp. TaxID=1932666 RepID=UPI000C362025|nr:peptidylprolyl isomerase [Haliea sp.]MBM69650.1 peptidylprolyl isomerase [Haliea sp.]|tara:strand:+ start:19803 stop:20549 length:747 start_codon:yes stop_codon:yes gene_type:complete
MDIVRIDGNTLTSDDLVGWLKLSGRFPHVVQDIIKEKLAATAARKRGLTASPEELQNRADQHRRALGLHRAKEANAFLDDASLSLEQYEAFLEDALLAEKMREDICSDAAINEYFSLHAPQFDAVELSHLVVTGEGKAREIVSLLGEDPDSFDEIAAEHSTAESATDGGRVGKVMRGALNPALEAKLFNASVGEVLGPFEADTENTFEIFSVTAKYDAVLDKTTRDAVSNLLYNEWLETAARDFRVEV